ncbi:MAG: YihY/virulence factor BrkB family protein [Anaerolineaceae bacterium]|jgi:membrane protein|nr:YihY/virulence factor BrkB family protein [Anaerolineaceae bacterium]
MNQNRDTALKIFARIRLSTVHHLRTFIQVIRQALQSYSRSSALEATAGLAYYSMFSIFPLALLLVVASSSWFKEEMARQQAIQFVTELFPISQSLTVQLIQSMLNSRGAITIVSAVGLLCAASGYFNLLVRNINRAWPGIRTRHFVRTRLEALLIVVGLGVLFLLSMLATSTFELLGKLNLPFWQNIFYQGPTRTILSFSIPLLLRMGVLWGLYFWIPKTPVNRKAAFLSALIVTVLWRMVTTLLTWYLSSGFIYYDVIYGSLSTTIISLFWLYLSNYVLLLGAHLCVSITQNMQKDETNTGSQMTKIVSEIETPAE